LTRELEDSAQYCVTACFDCDPLQLLISTIITLAVCFVEIIVSWCGA